jgi:mono/diheme cytochrome c family protein
VEDAIMRSGAFWIGVIGGALSAALIGLFAVPALGVFDMAATGSPGFLDWWGLTNWENSLEWRAPDTTLPATASADEGLEHYSSSCIDCHGAPDAERAEWAHHMRPLAPKLWQKGTQEMSDGELFRVVSEGVRMTGMPAFGPEHETKDIWNIVAFVRQLNHLTADQKQRLQEAAEREDHHHHHEHSGQHEPSGEHEHGE